jgi:hypothetical protein
MKGVPIGFDTPLIDCRERSGCATPLEVRRAGLCGGPMRSKNLRAPRRLGIISLIGHRPGFCGRRHLGWRAAGFQLRENPSPSRVVASGTDWQQKDVFPECAVSRRRQRWGRRRPGPWLRPAAPSGSLRRRRQCDSRCPVQSGRPEGHQEPARSFGADARYRPADIAYVQCGLDPIRR